MDFDARSNIRWTFSVFIQGIFSFWPLIRVLFEYESRRQGPLTPQMKLGLADFAQ